MTSNSSTAADAAASKGSYLTLCIVLLVGIAGGIFPVLQPLFVGGLIDHLGLASTQGGAIASSEMAGAGVGIILVSLLVTKGDWRRLLLISGVVALCGNLLSIFSGEFAMILGSRFLAGIGQGALMGVATAAIGSTANPDRNFAIFMVVLFSTGTLGVYTLSTIIADYGVNLGYILLVAMSILAILMFPLFPNSGTGETEVSTSQPGDQPGSGSLQRIVFGLIGILLFFTGLASVWPFMERMGLEVGLSAAQIGSSLTVSTSFGIAGGVVATLLGDRLGRIPPILFGISGIVFCITIIYLMPGQNSFVIGSRAFMFFWIFVVPYLMGTMALIDPTGRAVVLNMAMQYLGFTVGPSLVGFMVAGSTYTSGLIVGLISCAVSAFIFVPVALTLKRGR